MAILGFHSQNVPIIIEEDDMKFAKLPLPTNYGEVGQPMYYLPLN